MWVPEFMYTFPIVVHIVNVYEFSGTHFILRLKYTLKPLKYTLQTIQLVHWPCEPSSKSTRWMVCKASALIVYYILPKWQWQPWNRYLDISSIRLFGKLFLSKPIFSCWYNLQVCIQLDKKWQNIFFPTTVPARM